MKRLLLILMVLCLSCASICKADEYVSIKIFPEHVGVFTTVGKQQFVATGCSEDELQELVVDLIKIAQ